MRFTKCLLFQSCPAACNDPSANLVSPATTMPNREGDMFARLCLLSILSMGAFAAPAFSRNDGMPAYAQVGGWQVRVDPAVGNGCFASQYSADGTGIRLGIDPERHNLYLILGNPAWTSLEEGKTYRLRFVFDQAKAYDSDLEAGPLGDWVVLGRSGLGTDFVTDFVESAGVRIDYRGAPIAHLSLRNARAALTEMTKCQKEMESAGGGNSASVRPASDPFFR
jgi:hypothetical protein